MRHALLVPLALVAAGLVLPAAAPAADKPSRQVLYNDGPDGRFLLGGTWLFKKDRLDVGERRKFFRERGRGGWRPTTAPNAFNAGDDTNESMVGTVTWYRKDFRKPAGGDFVVRFESVNYRADVWLNGKKIGDHTGAYLPFELPLTKLKRTNRLVVRIDNRRRETDFPPSRFNDTGQPVGGWWNYGGPLREVYIRRIRRVSLTHVSARPDLPCATCPGVVNFRARATNFSDKAVGVRVYGSVGGRRVKLGSARIGRNSTRSFTRSLRIPNPHVWSLNDPYLYPARVQLSGGGRDSWSMHTGIRGLRVAGGRVTLNGQPVSLRGVGMHEDDPVKGAALDNTKRMSDLLAVKELGGTAIRSHYPLHPYYMEQADRMGLLVWSEIPVYSVRSREFYKRSVRRLAFQTLQDNIESNGSHPSVMVWSIGNELASKPKGALAGYIRGAARLAKQLDPTRLVSLAIVGYTFDECVPAYNRLDVIGVNEYFGWYPGPVGQVADQDLLPGFLENVKACYPGHGIMVTEFGAEANREGPQEEKGTYSFQQDFVRFHLGVFASKPWLSGAFYWTLQEFRVRPGWDGGNPYPQPPIHQKGLVTFTGEKKPAYFDVQSSYQSTTQVGTPAPAGQSKGQSGR